MSPPTPSGRRRSTAACTSSGFPWPTRLTEQLWPQAASLMPATSSTCAQPMTGAGGVVYPVPPAYVGTDNHNWGGSGSHWSSWHTGTDFSVPCGTPVLAATAGTVEIETDQAWAGTWLVKVVTRPDGSPWVRAHADAGREPGPAGQGRAATRRGGRTWERHRLPPGFPRCTCTTGASTVPTTSTQVSGSRRTRPRRARRCEDERREGSRGRGRVRALSPRAWLGRRHRQGGPRRRRRPARRGVHRRGGQGHHDVSRARRRHRLRGAPAKDG